MKKYKILALCLLVGLSINAHAEEDINIQDVKRYQKAYATCSPAVHQLVRQECNYGLVFEKNYQHCMAGQGFQEEMELDSTMYESYLENYKYCQAIAQSATQESCQYGQRYQRHYNKCMAKYGFDGKGEYVGTSTKHNSSTPGESDDAQAGKEEYFEYDF